MLNKDLEELKNKATRKKQEIMYEGTLIRLSGRILFH